MLYGYILYVKLPSRNGCVVLQPNFFNFQDVFIYSTICALFLHILTIFHGFLPIIAILAT